MTEGNEREEAEYIRLAQTGKPWGFIEDGKFVELPKLPMIRAGFRDPPFVVTIPYGDVRNIIVEPDHGD